MSAGTNVDQMLRYKGFSVEIEGVDGAPASEDAEWVSVTGGTDASFVVELGPNGPVEGPKLVTLLCLEGPMVAGRTWLAKWLAETALGKDARRDLRVASILKFGAARRRGKATAYKGCRIVHWKASDMDARGTETITERICIVAERAEIA
ncbi:MAG TPA: hypothetical protein VFM93_08845 [Candidatus Limnocylindria bacterium]|nr:hypothetical protein [Candidatus Limnocylindria bacterium]